MNDTTFPHVSYLLFDVFTDAAFAGNPLAVFPECSGLDVAAMQRIAGELNLSESVFLTATGLAARPATLRIFTPRRELRFAGHPTVGSAIAVADVLGWIPGDVDEFVLGEAIGDVPIRLDRGRLTTAWLTTPAVTLRETFAREAAARLLGVGIEDVRPDVPPQIVSAGNPFLYVPLRDCAAVDRAILDAAVLGEFVDDPRSLSGVFLFSLRPGGTYARMFAPMSGIAEDPATGSATGPLFAYLLAHGAAQPDAAYLSEQGVRMGRRSLLHVRIVPRTGAPPQIEVGGTAVHVGDGALRIPTCE